MHAQRARGELRFVAPGHVYIWRLSVEGCVQVEALAGVTWDTLVQQANKGQAKAVRWLVWTALQPYHAAAFGAIETVGTLIDAVGGLAPIRKALADLLALNTDDSDDLPKPKPDAKARALPRKRGPLWRRWYLQVRSVGLTPEQFWRLSMKELWWELAVARQADRQRHDCAAKTAWYAAALVWQQKLPALDRLLAVDHSNDESDLLDNLQRISEVYRLPLHITRTPAHA